MSVEERSPAPGSARGCRVCGCTDRFGCEERCHWDTQDPSLCSVCSGATKMRRRAYTRCKPDTEPMLLPPLEIYNPAGRLVGAAWYISEAQAMARGIDAYYKLLRTQARLVWQRGPIAHRPVGEHHGH